MSDVVEKNWSGLLTEGSNGRLYSNPNAAPGGRFLVENPVASPIPLTRIYPLSNAEIAALTAEGSAHWYQTAAVAGIPWRLPLGFMGGMYPFDYTLEGPEGAEIVYVGREERVPPFYEYIEWENPTMGEHEFTLTCVDQNDDSHEVSFTLTVYDEDDTTNVGWVNPAIGNNANAGSRASPWATINGWYGGSLGSNTHRNKIILYEGATGIDVGGVSGCSYSTNNSRLRMNDNKPKCHIAVGDFDVDGNGANYTFESGVGWTWAGSFIHTNPLVDEGGQRIQWFRGALQYGFIGMGYTATGGTFAIDEGSNSSFFEFPGGATDGAFFPNVILDDVQTTGEGWAGIKNNNASGVLCTGWEVSDIDNCQIFHHKGGADIVRTEERGCIAIDTITGSQFRNVQWINSPVSRELNTWCWNNYDVASSPNPEGGIQFQGDPEDNFSDQAGWRNNERENFTRLGAVTGIATLSRNVRIHSGAETNGIEDGFGMVYDPDEEYTSTNAADLDATTNLLAGAARAAHLGEQGCEMTVNE